MRHDNYISHICTAFPPSCQEKEALTPNQGSVKAIPSDTESRHASAGRGVASWRFDSFLSLQWSPCCLHGQKNDFNSIKRIRLWPLLNIFESKKAFIQISSHFKLFFWIGCFKVKADPQTPASISIPASGSGALHVPMAPPLAPMAPSIGTPVASTVSLGLQKSMEKSMQKSSHHKIFQLGKKLGSRKIWLVRFETCWYVFRCFCKLLGHRPPITLAIGTPQNIVTSAPTFTTDSSMVATGDSSTSDAFLAENWVNIENFNWEQWLDVNTPSSDPNWENWIDFLANSGMTWASDVWKYVDWRTSSLRVVSMLNCSRFSASRCSKVHQVGAFPQHHSRFGLSAEQVHYTYTGIRSESPKMTKTWPKIDQQNYQQMDQTLTNKTIKIYQNMAQKFTKHPLGQASGACPCWARRPPTDDASACQGKKERIQSMGKGRKKRNRII